MNTAKQRFLKDQTRKLCVVLPIDVSQRAKNTMRLWRQANVRAFERLRQLGPSLKHDHEQGGNAPGGGSGAGRAKSCGLSVAEISNQVFYGADARIFGRAVSNLEKRVIRNVGALGYDF